MKIVKTEIPDKLEVEIWIIIESLDKADSEKSRLLYKSGMLDKGEAEAIVLTKKLKTDWFLTDDTGARIFANTQ